MNSIDPMSLLSPRRSITGISAILLPFHVDRSIDWDGFDGHVSRTFAAGLTPAVNMDTGYANLIDAPTRSEVLERTEDIASGRDFVGGVFVADAEGNRLNMDAYRSGIDQVQRHGGTPIIFQSFGLTGASDDQIVDAYQTIAADCDQFLAFELGTMFAPFGKIYSLSVYEQLMKIPQCVGAKHSSLKRELEWQRLELRNRVRDDFRVLTGNDLAIDMVMYGSDYLLGLSTFAPEAFAQRDAYWAAGDNAFYELNDLLQYLGMFAFRDPVPAYKHSAAMFLHQRGCLSSSETHRDSPRRPDSDQEILELISRNLDQLLPQEAVR